MTSTLAPATAAECCVDLTTVRCSASCESCHRDSGGTFIMARFADGEVFYVCDSCAELVEVDA